MIDRTRRATARLLRRVNSWSYITSDLFVDDSARAEFNRWKSCAVVSGVKESGNSGARVRARLVCNPVIVCGAPSSPLDSTFARIYDGELTSEYLAVKRSEVSVRKRIGLGWWSYGFETNQMIRGEILVSSRTVRRFVGKEFAK